MRGSLLWSVLTALLLGAGCVEREFLITSQPAGAEVFLDGEFVGTTPVTVPFVHYGNRELEIRKQGFAPQRQRVAIQPPFYSIFPLDFLSEVLLPFPLSDKRIFHFRLNPLTPWKGSTQALWKKVEGITQKTDGGP